MKWQVPRHTRGATLHVPAYGALWTAEPASTARGRSSIADDERGSSWHDSHQASPPWDGPAVSQDEARPVLGKTGRDETRLREGEHHDENVMR